MTCWSAFILWRWRTLSSGLPADCIMQSSIMDSEGNSNRLLRKRSVGPRGCPSFELSKQLAIQSRLFCVSLPQNTHSTSGPLSLSTADILWNFSIAAIPHTLPDECSKRSLRRSRTLHLQPKWHSVKAFYFMDFEVSARFCRSSPSAVL